MTLLSERHQVLELVGQAITAGARQERACGAISLSERNPYSESLFKTLKYRSDYPTRAFENLFAARQWVGTFVHWYNLEHCHSANAVRHHGRSPFWQLFKDCGRELTDGAAVIMHPVARAEEQKTPRRRCLSTTKSIDSLDKTRTDSSDLYSSDRVQRKRAGGCARRNCRIHRG